jgi:hypothetical protein
MKKSIITTSNKVSVIIENKDGEKSIFIIPK